MKYDRLRIVSGRFKFINPPEGKSQLTKERDSEHVIDSGSETRFTIKGNLYQTSFHNVSQMDQPETQHYWRAGDLSPAGSTPKLQTNKPRKLRMGEWMAPRQGLCPPRQQSVYWRHDTSTQYY